MSGSYDRTRDSKSREDVRPRLLSVRQAAAYLGISHWTVRELVWKGELPEVRLGRRLLLDLRDLDRLIEARKKTEVS